MDTVVTMETTLGELAVALTAEALEMFCNEEDAYKVAAFALMHILWTHEDLIEC